MIVAAAFELPPWLTDVSVLTALVTALGGVLGTAITAVVTNLAHRKDKENEERDNKLADQYDDMSGKLDNIIAQTQETGERVMRIENGTKVTQRYRLYHDLSKEILRGYTTKEDFGELSKLFDSYTSLGGNGEIAMLFERYRVLPLEHEWRKQHENEKKEENGADSN